MRYFTYSPLVMSEQSALEKAYRYLENGMIVHVGHYEIEIERIQPGVTPRARSNTYLVRLEPDGSTRVVHKDFQ